MNRDVEVTLLYAEGGVVKILLPGHAARATKTVRVPILNFDGSLGELQFTRVDDGVYMEETK